MKTHFRIANEEFAHYLKLTAGGESYYFNRELTLEHNVTDVLEVELELVRAEDYFRQKTKNPLARALLAVLKWIVYIIVFFADNHDGVRADKGYTSFDPFEIKRSLLIRSPQEKTVSITYTAAKYDSRSMEYTAPQIEACGDGVELRSEKTSFSASALKSEWKDYYVPGFAVVMTLIVALNVLGVILFAGVIARIPTCTTAENVGGIVGMSFCSLVLLALLVLVVFVIRRAKSFLKRVTESNLQDN